VATTTTKLALTKPDPNPTTGDFLDVSVLNTNADKIDDAVGVLTCTSSTRPTGGARWVGRLIRETDTNNRVYMWDGTNWIQLYDPTWTGAWTAYTPVWSTTGTAPTVGNATLSGRYRVMGKTMDVWLKFVWGSTSVSASSGLWRFSLPFAPLADQLLNAYVDDTSAGLRWAGTARTLGGLASGDNMRIVMQSSHAGISANSAPMAAWATGDSLMLQGTVELA